MSAEERAKAESGKEEQVREPEEIREEIEQTREEMGGTVAAVASKTDVKKQARGKVEEVKGEAGAKAEQAKAKARELGDKAKEAAPDSAGEGVQQAQHLVRENPMPAIGGAFLAGFVLGRLMSR